MMVFAGSDPLSHIADSKTIELFETAGVKIDLPFSKFMLVMALAAGLVMLIYIPLAKRIAGGGAPKGRFWNGFEFLLTFIRDQVAKPAIGEHDYKKYLPYLWTVFLFILVMNLLGILPFFPTATSNLWVTGTLAFISFVIIHVGGLMANHGPVGYLKTFIPHIDMDTTMMKILGPGILVAVFCLEILGAFIRGFVLAVRLFANMMGGHVALFVILSFITQAGIAVVSGQLGEGPFWGITAVVVIFVTILNLLELFVACLQAFVFTFLTATFIGLALHPEH